MRGQLTTTPYLAAREGGRERELQIALALSQCLIRLAYKS